MPLEQTITIVNNSGNIISTGNRLLSIFKEARGAYHDKKAELQSERSASKPSQTLDYRDDDLGYKYEFEPDPATYGRGYVPEHDYGDRYAYGPRRRSYDVRSQASSRRSHRSRHQRYHGVAAQPALTEHNLKALSEISSAAPSRAPPPAAYRSPYAETMPMDLALSKLHLSSHPERRSTAQLGRRDAIMVPRRRSEPDMGGGHHGSTKDIDMDLAYGNIPPDLEDRIDLDPSRAAELDELQAQRLVHKVEGLLDEAHCLQHSATAIIKHLQQKPDAAAEVALTLADLSSAVSKMSPALLGFLKGGSPAVFALLASPQFLIGTGIAVGVTVVMFGGWKIVKRISQAQTSRDVVPHQAAPLGPQPRMQSEYSAGIDEALVVDEELSTIETWRRGIMPFGAADESADLELITPEADRVAREKYAKDDLDPRSHRGGRTQRSPKTRKTTHRDKGKEKDVPKTKSSRENTAAESVSGGSQARGKKSGKGKEKPTVKAIEDGRSRRGDDASDVAFRHKARHGDNMLKAIFKNKDKDKSSGRKELVVA